MLDWLPEVINYAAYFVGMLGAAIQLFTSWRFAGYIGCVVAIAMVWMAYFIANTNGDQGLIANFWWCLGYDALIIFSYWQYLQVIHSYQNRDRTGR